MAIVGATGAVGEVLLQVLAERRFPVGELRPLASERSAGTTVRFAGTDIPVELARPEALDGADFVFFAATGSLSKDLAPEAARRGAVAIDKSGTWRMDPKVPLVVPEVNPEALAHHEGIVSCPNCTTIGFVMALEPIRRAAGLRSVVVTTLQAVSGAGKPGHRRARAAGRSRRRAASGSRRRPSRRRSRTTSCRCARPSATTATPPRRSSSCSRPARSWTCPNSTSP